MIELTGTWKLIRTTSTLADGTRMPAPYGGEAADGAVGLVTFTPQGRMAAVLYDGREATASGSPREFVSYAGAFTFDGRQLVTRVDASSRADWMDSDQVREASFDAGVLVLRPPLRAYTSQPEQRTLYWQRLTEAG